jgi:hypothetical protein
MGQRQNQKTRLAMCCAVFCCVGTGCWTDLEQGSENRLSTMKEEPKDLDNGKPSSSGFTLTFWGGLLHRKMETKNSQHPTGTPRHEQPNLSTPTCKRNLNTAPTCATSITNSWLPFIDGVSLPPRQGDPLGEVLDCIRRCSRCIHLRCN